LIIGVYINTMTVILGMRNSDGVKEEEGYIHD